MNCRQCGAHLAPDDLVCGTCGTLAEATLPAASTVAVKRTTRTTAKTRRLSATTLLILVFACGFVGLIATAIAGGVAVGLQDRKADEQARIDQFYQEGLANRAAGKLPLAKADFEYVLRLNPAYPGAREQLAQVQDLLTVKPTPTTSAMVVNVTQELYQAGLAAYQKKDWQKAIDIFAQVRSLDATYEKDAIARMLYDAALTYGL